MSLTGRCCKRHDRGMMALATASKYRELKAINNNRGRYPVSDILSYEANRDSLKKCLNEMIFIYASRLYQHFYTSFHKTRRGLCFVPDYSEKKQPKQTQRSQSLLKSRHCSGHTRTMWVSETVFWRKNHTDLSGPVQSVQAFVGDRVARLRP